MKRVIYLWIACVPLLDEYARYERADSPTTPAPVVARRSSSEVSLEMKTTPMESAEESTEGSAEAVSAKPERPWVKVESIYMSEYVAGTPDLMDAITENIDRAEINVVVIDVKGDNGRTSHTMDSSMVTELGAVKKFTPDMPGLMIKLEEHNIYTIARVVAFRDPYLTEQWPDLSLKLTDRGTYRDNKGLVWVNPYKKEAWDYPVEMGIETHKAGFDKIQFDYIRFSTEKGISDAVHEGTGAHGRTKVEIVAEFTGYVYKGLSAESVFVTTNVFGATVGNGQDSDSVGQPYGNMVRSLDYTYPMIYPSHYGDGNPGTEHLDTQSHDVTLGVLKESEDDLKTCEAEGEDQAIVRPWLQDLMTSYLVNYTQYGDREVRARAQAIYDAGYDKWLSWNAACKYHWDGLLTSEEAEAEATQAVEPRVAKPETEPTQEETTVLKTYPHVGEE